MAVITISKEHGAGGREIAVQLARTLGYQLVDKAMIIKVAQQAKVTSERVEKYDQEEYSPMAKYLSNMFLANPSLYTGMGFEMPMAGPLPGGYDFFDAEQYLKLTQGVIEGLYQKGDVIIVGRGSQVLLAGKQGCLHLRMVAPLEERIKRAMAQGLPEKEAKDRIHKRDKARAAYIRDFYGRDAADPSLYHLVINTHWWGTDKVVSLVKEALKLVSGVMSP